MIQPKFEIGTEIFFLIGDKLYGPAVIDSIEIQAHYEYPRGLPGRVTPGRVGRIRYQTNQGEHDRSIEDENMFLTLAEAEKEQTERWNANLRRQMR